MTQTGPHTHSPYRRGADDGFVFGAYLTASFLTMVWSSAVPLLGLVSMLLLAGVPVFIYMKLRRSFVADCGHTLLSSLWMQGIATFACGSLIAGAVATAYLKWIEPDFIIGRLREAIDFYSGSGWERGHAPCAVGCSHSRRTHLARHFFRLARIAAHGSARTIAAGPDQTLTNLHRITHHQWI